ncbi:hypothetical protein [Altibacter sp.]|uniref:hypothetical protein n=1 Tax=Altibacter sp. TaxID=2024823 RepID=UPI000C92235E|nr:hypothetical protein [Altibacter sp.]MAP53535.1 hypothetical protein [Altibacter sp.]|tara:strand:+ start:1016 stop:1225 length:210 start_codon:yes stop_codon:yes gene_type:complete
MIKPVTFLYIITIVVLIAAVVWEYYMQQWLSYQPNQGANVMRVDLFVIWPLVITLVALSLFRIFRKNKN